MNLSILSVSVRGFLDKFEPSFYRFALRLHKPSASCADCSYFNGSVVYVTMWCRFDSEPPPVLSMLCSLFNIYKRFFLTANMNPLLLCIRYNRCMKYEPSALIYLTIMDVWNSLQGVFVLVLYLPTHAFDYEDLLNLRITCRYFSMSDVCSCLWVTLGTLRCFLVLGL